MKRYLTSFVVASALTLAACGDSLGPGNASQDDRADIETLLDASGWFTEDFGVDGLAEDASLSSGFDLGFAALSASPQDTIQLVRRWGRRHGRPVVRERRIEVHGDTAEVSVTLSFEGQFLFDPPGDSVREAVTKRAHETRTQRAVFVRREGGDSAGHRWRMLGVSPSEWQMTDPAQQTVDIQSITVFVNDQEALVIEDPSALLEADTRLPALEVDDVVRVVVEIDNATGNGNVPETFAFIHINHASPNVRLWVRLPMEQNDLGQWVRQWTVRFAGRERILIDAIDSNAFNTASDDYRANLIGIPYRVRRNQDGATDGS